MTSHCNGSHSKTGAQSVSLLSLAVVMSQSILCNYFKVCTKFTLEGRAERLTRSDCGKLFHRQAPEKDILVLNMSILGQTLRQTDRQTETQRLTETETTDRQTVGRESGQCVRVCALRACVCVCVRACVCVCACVCVSV